MEAAAAKPDQAASTEAAALYKKQDLSLKEGETIKCGTGQLCMQPEMLKYCFALGRQTKVCDCWKSIFFWWMMCRINMARRTTGDKAASSGTTGGGFLSGLAPLPSGGSQTSQQQQLAPPASSLRPPPAVSQPVRAPLVEGPLCPADGLARACLVA